MVILGFSGKCTAGKSTAADYVKKNYTCVKKFSLATSIKHSIMEDFGLTADQVFKEKDKPIMINGKVRAPRELMIAIGNFYRTLDDSYWVRKLWKQIKQEARPGDLILIDDIRYPNEIEFLKNQSPAEFIRIERPDVPLINNVSETSLDDYGGFKGYVYNNDSKKALYANIDLQIEGVLSEHPYMMSRKINQEAYK